MELSTIYQEFYSLNDLYVRFLNEEFFVRNLFKDNSKVVKVKIELKSIKDILKRIEVDCFLLNYSRKCL
ncbi:MAG: hypothetical protein QXL96_07185 [Ignisphaera sp.]